MARYEFVEGKSSKFWEARVDGPTLVVTYGRIGTTGQSQTKTFTTPELALREHDELVAEKTKKGYTLAAGATAPPSPPDGRRTDAFSATVLRKDFYVYNEATGFTITSRRLGGKGIDGGSPPWHRAVRAGDLIPIELTQDDPFFIRIVVGGTLEPQEAEEWVGRLDWKLRVPDGHLVVCGGAEYIMEAFEGDESHYLAEYVRHLEIPRGEYRATIYMYFGGVNGDACLKVAREGDEPDPLGEWFRRTRPNEAFPAWVHNACVRDPDEDPDHEQDWKTRQEVADPNEHYVDFLLHLTPLEPGERVAMPTLSEEGGEDGWFCQPFVCRAPDRIPLGLPARDPEGLEKETATEPRQEPPLPVHERAARFRLQPLDRPVEVPLVHLVRLFRLAWFCHAWTMPFIRVDAPPGVSLMLPVVDDEHVRPGGNANGLVIEFIPSGRQSGALRALAAVAPTLASLPDGCLLTLEAAYVDPEELKKARPMGLHRYEGRIRGGVLTIARAFPVHDAARLEAALALAAQVDEAETIDAGTEETAAKAMKTLETHPFLQDNPPVRRGATGLTTKTADPQLLTVVAEVVFQKAFKNDFPLFDFDADEDEEEEVLETPVPPRDGEPPMPPIGVELMRGSRRRVFHLSDAAAMGPAAEQRIADVERDLLPLGFTLVGDIVCVPMQAVMVRAYAQPGGTVWAAMLISSYSRGTFEFVSDFERGASLTTTTNPTVRDELYRHAYKTRRADAGVLELWADHQRRAAYLSQVHGAALPVDATPHGLAAAIERSIQRQEEPGEAAERTLLLAADGRSYFSADIRAIDPAVPALVTDADGRMDALGFAPVGDVVGTFFTNHACRGYARPDGDTWAILTIDASTQKEPAAAWEFVTAFEKGAVLSSTRGALSKDEPKRKIFRILDPLAPPEALLARHDARKADLSKKWGSPLTVSADLVGLAKEAAGLLKRTIG